MIAVSNRVWSALCHAQEPLSAPDLQRATGADLCSVHRPLRAWSGAGILNIVDGRPKRFVMSDTTDRTPLPPTVRHDGRIVIRKRSSRERLWSAMRTLKTFDLPMLQIASTASERETRIYINALVHAGFVQRVDDATDFPRFRLARPCGPKAAKITQSMRDGRWVKELVDPNTGSVSALPRRQPRCAAPAPAERGVG